MIFLTTINDDHRKINVDVQSASFGSFRYNCTIFSRLVPQVKTQTWRLLSFSFFRAFVHSFGSHGRGQTAKYDDNTLMAMMY
jgi:hypothetical protein